MPRATECVMDIHLATALKQFLDGLPVKITKGDIGLRCKECGKPVTPHQSKGESAHFEHLKRNPKCSLSDPARS